MRERKRSKGKLLQRILIQCRTMIEYVHFTILNCNSVKDNQVPLKLLSKYVLELEYLHSFKIHVIYQLKRENVGGICHLLKKMVKFNINCGTKWHYRSTNVILLM